MIELTPESIESAVLESELPVIVFFTAQHCVPCRFVYPLLADLIKEYEGRLRIVKADTEVVSIFRDQLNVLSIPRLVIFKDGKELKRIDPRNKGDMRLEFDAVCASTGTSADPAVQEAYETAVQEARKALSSTRDSIGSWWASIVGPAAEACDAAWQPLNDATDAALSNDATYRSMTEEAQRWAWVYKREELKSEERFSAVRTQIATADADFAAVSEPHADERNRRYQTAESTYDNAISAARLAYKDKTGFWPAGDLPASE